MCLKCITISVVFMFLINLSLFANDRGSEYETYFQEAAMQYDVNPEILHAIADTESSFNPNAVNCANTNKSCDFGLMQINSIHLPFLAKHGISRDHLFDPRVNIFIGAWVLKNCINKYGQDYRALNCYNGKIRNNSYYAKVLRNYHLAQSRKDKLLAMNGTIKRQEQ